MQATSLDASLAAELRQGKLILYDGPGGLPLYQTDVSGLGPIGGIRFGEDTYNLFIYLETGAVHMFNLETKEIEEVDLVAPIDEESEEEKQDDSDYVPGSETCPSVVITTEDPSHCSGRVEYESVNAVSRQTPSTFSAVVKVVQHYKWIVWVVHLTAFLFAWILLLLDNRPSLLSGGVLVMVDLSFVEDVALRFQRLPLQRFFGNVFNLVDLTAIGIIFASWCTIGIYHPYFHGRDDLNQFQVVLQQMRYLQILYSPMRALIHLMSAIMWKDDRDLCALCNDGKPPEDRQIVGKDR
mmetsp:Transcript_2744/g.6339  ORF Transcript_2744/g.6339 Transcript_2744/m.6339 type:complete len:296 (+) Transcript_2744:40-927(+)